MTALDQLLTFILEGKSRVAHLMAAAGYSEDQIRGAWNEARAQGFTEGTGLGQDRLTAEGRNKAAR
jgi:hypothetical protein